MICARQMNKCSVVVLILLLSLGMSTSNAQPRPERPPMPTPEEIAQRKTEKMDKEISLDEKQVKKIFKIYLKEENAKKEAREGGFPPMGGFPGGGPGGFPGGAPGGFPGGGPGGFGGGFPGGGGGFPGPPPGGMRPEGFPGGMPGGPLTATVNGKDIESDEYIDWREKKFKKILTPEQYQRFITIHPDPTEFFIK